MLYFPEGWAHHTEATPHGAAPVRRGGLTVRSEPTCSFSLGFRTDGAYLL